MSDLDRLVKATGDWTTKERGVAETPKPKPKPKPTESRKQRRRRNKAKKKAAATKRLCDPLIWASKSLAFMRGFP